MVCHVRFTEKPTLNDPILIEGLPGIGFVASIVTLHLIRELNAKPFAEVKSSAFQDFSTSTEDGGVASSENRLYYFRRNRGGDLVFLYGNTQALTPFGQYELYGRILDVFQGFGGETVVTLGGMRVESVSSPLKVYCAATDEEMLNKAVKYGATVIKGGHIFGAAGLLIGLGKLRGMHGLCLLGETTGQYPDPDAALAVMEVLQNVIDLDVKVSGLDLKAKETVDYLYEFVSEPRYEKGEKGEVSFRWSI
ncbi:PAC2 family protein [Candidatus Bathyarchaeota archaeon]|nr:PAC2 family protein [Candidatus Bathyarchaeota archaeon]